MASIQKVEAHQVDDEKEDRPQAAGSAYTMTRKEVCVDGADATFSSSSSRCCLFCFLFFTLSSIGKLKRIGV